MNQYHLQPYKGTTSRYRCPACNHRTKSFSRYINTETNEEVAPHVGRCGREDKCAYHLSPSQYFKEAGIIQPVRTRKPQPKPGKTKPETEYYISPDYVNDSFCNYDKNNFVSYLISRFGFDTADTLVGRYRIGTSNYWHGATIFWQLDTHGYVRTGKIMLYDKQTGKRVKRPFNHINWVHSFILSSSSTGSSSLSSEENTATATATATATFQLRQCLFGEHLLITSPFKPVAVVESEKTAIIASALMPAFIWLASGSLDGLSVEKCKVLQSRQVVLFPDVNAYSKWKRNAMELRRAMPGTTIIVSDELERLATDYERKQGVDIGDVLR